MTPLPYSEPLPKAIFDTVLGVFAVLETVVRFRSRRNHDGARADRGSLFVVALALGGGLALGFLAAGTLTGLAVRGARWPLFVTGLVLVVAGIVVRQWAVRLLGRRFTVDVRVFPGQAIVDHGPYRWVRHPSYSGLLLICLGTGLALGNVAALAIDVVVPAIGIAVRIRVEEDALLRGLGEPYRRFAATRARVVPKLW